MSLLREVASEEGLLRLRREASAASALEHPNIVRFVTLVEHDGAPHIVMEYLDGQTLKKLLAGERRLDLASALLVAIQVAQALQCAHDKGIVHRDLKPGNILLTRSNQVKLLDFGIAKMLALALGTGLSPQDRLTKSGEILGTKGYMAPEQARGEAVDARADVFSFGCVLYQMLCGKSAFSGHNALDRYVAIVSEEPGRLKTREPSVPDDLDELVHRSLSKDSVDRPADMNEVLAVLRAAQKS
jgi:serine/threonine protein kinase